MTSEELQKQYHKETKENIIVSAWSGDDVYSDGYVEWLEEMLVKTLSIAPVSLDEQSEATVCPKCSSDRYHEHRNPLDHSKTMCRCTECGTRWQTGN
tara:strand:- start:1 stop:291 length:291 start_codon:yes stop_codon:yes gene_type:complete